MKHLRHIPFFLLIIFLFTACNDTAVSPTPTPLSPTPDPQSPPTPAFTATGITISELLLGMPDSNSTEFIELFNPTSEPVDLTGWTLVYLLNEENEEEVYHWRADDPALIPGLGHYLLVHVGKDVGVAPDGWFDTNLFDGRGSLILRKADGTAVDIVGWGDAPAGGYEAEPIPAWSSGTSAERLPQGSAGNSVDTNSNADDFAVTTPNPQNSGSQMTPLPEAYLQLELDMPAQIDPGVIMESEIRVVNHSGEPLADVLVTIPIPEKFTVNSLPDGAQELDGRIHFTMPNIPANETAVAHISWQTPYTYLDTILANAHAAADGRVTAFAAPQPISVSGGTIPIEVARGLVGSSVTVEGVATMYTGGFFAGSTGTKFYIQDDTGGVQVYVPGGGGSVNVELGDVVRVTGGIEIYRDSIELVPGDFATDIEIVSAGEPLAAAAVSVEQIESDDTILGGLHSIEGTATRVEELNFSYEIDITDDLGNTTVVNIEKDTGVTIDEVTVGNRYHITGISEFYSTVRQIKPRIQADIAEIFPPDLYLQQSAVNNIQPGELLTYTIVATNHLPHPLTGVQVGTRLPTGGITLLEVLDGGEIQSDGTLLWTVGDLAADGASVAVRYVVQVDDNVSDVISVIPAAAEANELDGVVLSQAYQTFVGSGVPISAIQGEGDRSPYVGDLAATTGVVTAVFPELGGYWLQSQDPDNNPATSEGVFVLDETSEVAVGDVLEINGRIREISGQTTIIPEADVIVLSSGNALPAPTAYDPPADPIAGEAYKEAREGMIVTVPQAQAIAPTTQYGEYALVSEMHGVDTIRRTDDPVGFIIFVDDGSSAVHQDQSTLPYAVTKGDVVQNVTGPLAYTFGQFKIEPVEVPELVYAERPFPTIHLPNENQLSIATFNVENLFDPFDPHPSSPPRPTLDAYRQRMEKIVGAIISMGVPDIIAFQEVEDIGALQDIAEQEHLLQFGYTPYLIEGDDSRGIDVGYLVRPRKVQVEGVASYPGPDGLTTRHPLVLTTTVAIPGGTQTIYLLNNHFLSLAAGEEATEPQRTAQAAWNVTLMEQIRAQDPDAQFVVMGDLNSFYQTPPIDTLEAGGLDHVYEFFTDPADYPYTYIFEGKTQTLDHILVSPELMEKIILVEALHMNADFPLINLEDGSARRVSDHDPLLVMLNLTD